MLTIEAPAKVNLTLEVLEKRPDDFHEIRSIMQAVSLYDNLHFESSRGVSIKSGMPDWTAAESLVSKAVSLLQQASGCSEGVSIEMEKRIPLLSGLGGDSSDAAAVLRGLNQLWELNLSRENLLELAGQLGSDVSFFLYGGTALIEGRGEKVSPLPPLPRMWFVIALPPVPRLPGKTGQLYRSLKKNHYTDGQITDKMVEEIKAGRELSDSLLFNIFENVAFGRFSGLEAAREHFLKLGAPVVHLAGSGPALYTMVEDKDRAEDLCLLLRKQRMEAFVAETLPAIEEIE
ncbi:4-(cytidine 5'-diphospho)-2-C-methyl-D-erythritol kinase [Chloroflexota bacterium]